MIPNQLAMKSFKNKFFFFHIAQQIFIDCFVPQHIQLQNRCN